VLVADPERAELVESSLSAVKSAAAIK
jgi:hypothetical protein